MIYNRFTTLAAFAALVGVSSGQHSTWMSNMSNAASDYGYDLFDSTIFEIIWPGSANPGMYEDAIPNNPQVSQVIFAIHITHDCYFIQL